MALVAVFLAVFRDWRPFLAPGERATIMVIARDRDQAGEILNYVKAYFHGVPMLAALLENETGEVGRVEQPRSHSGQLGELHAHARLCDCGGHPR